MLKFQQIDEFRWRIPQEGRMRVPGLIFATEEMMADIRSDQSPEQVANVAHLPGIVSHSIAMPDMHWGYGFPIGGVAAFDEDEGVLSPGGVGYDINCGVRLLRSDIPAAELRSTLPDLSKKLFKAIPSGMGKGSQLKLSDSDLDRVLRRGAKWAVDNGYGAKADIDVIEEHGQFEGADPGVLSERALQRGRPQLGSLGSGNHFCEVAEVAEIYDAEAAEAMGLTLGSTTVMIHSGSRGLGYQVCQDSLKKMLKASVKYGIALPDRQLCSAPLTSPEADDYFKAMACAINYAFANRQVMTQLVRQTFEAFLGQSAKALAMDLVYDVCHNIAKWEEHEVDGELRRLCVHRKGATRAFGPGHKKVPRKYRDVGQPVLVPGDMGRYSFVLAGTDQAMSETFGSCCHGAGRRLSRRAALKAARRRDVLQELEQKGIFVRSQSTRTVAEEMPEAYKDVANVVDVIAGAGIAKKVARLEPMAVIKG